MPIAETSHPKNALAGQKLAPRFFCDFDTEARPEILPQTLGTHLEGVTYIYGIALGSADAPINGVGAPSPTTSGTTSQTTSGVAPTRPTTPTGRALNVVVNGNNVTITIGIKYKGAGATTEVTNAFNAAIQKEWSGTFGQYTVTTNVIRVDSGGYFDITVLPGQQIPYMTGIGALTGTWYAGAGAWYAAHELGHGMGLIDRYTESMVNGQRITTPISGYERNIMGAYGMPASEADIREIIRINQRP